MRFVFNDSLGIIVSYNIFILDKCGIEHKLFELEEVETIIEKSIMPEELIYKSKDYTGL